MTDQQNHTTSNGVKLTITNQYPDQVCVMMYDHRSGPSSHVGMILPTSRLLAMIDSIAPDAMRAYLRERSDLMDSPEPTTTENLKPLMEHFGIKTLDVPEADSPEDTDEPDPVDQLRESGRQLGEAWRAFTEGVRAGTFGTDR